MSTSEEEFFEVDKIIDSKIDEVRYFYLICKKLGTVSENTQQTKHIQGYLYVKMETLF